MFYLTNGGELLHALNWVKDKDNTYPISNANRYCFWCQHSDNQSQLVYRGPKGVWFCKYIESQAEIGTTVLFDLDELLDKASDVSVFKTEPITVGEVNEGYLNFKIGKNRASVRTYGNITASTYSGDISDFELPDLDKYTTEYKLDYESFYPVISLGNSFSSLKSETSSKFVYVNISSGKINYLVPDKSNGYCYMLVKLNYGDLQTEDEFCIPGKYLSQMNDIASNVVGIKASDDSLYMYTDKGYIIFPRHPESLYFYLKAAYNNLFMGLELTSTRTLDIKEFDHVIELSQPSKNATKKSVIIQADKDLLNFYRSGDRTKKEVGIADIPIDFIDEIATEFETITVSHAYLQNSVKALKQLQKYLSSTNVSLYYVQLNQVVINGNTHLLLKPLSDYPVQFFVTAQENY